MRQVVWNTAASETVFRFHLLALLEQTGSGELWNPLLWFFSKTQSWHVGQQQSHQLHRHWGPATEWYNKNIIGKKHNHPLKEF